MVVVLDVSGDGDGDVDLIGDGIVPTQPRRAAVEAREMLSFQKLDVYQRAIQFLSLAYEVVDALPRGHADRTDQLKRSAESVVRNIAEGAGRWTAADSASRFKIARGEAMECAACLDILKVRGVISEDAYTRGSEMLGGVVAMLTKMI